MAADKGKGNEAKEKGTEGKAAPAIPPKRGVSDKMPPPEVRVVDDGKGKKKEPKPTKTGMNYILLKNYSAEGGTKMPLQCQQILKILDEAPDKTLEKKDLLAKMTEIVQTRQPIERILAFYQPRLISGEFIKMTPVIAPAPAPAETPAAEAKPAEVASK